MLHYLINICLHTDWRLAFYSNLLVSWWMWILPCLCRCVRLRYNESHFCRSIWLEFLSDEVTCLFGWSLSVTRWHECLWVYLWRGDVSVSRVQCERLLCTRAAAAPSAFEASDSPKSPLPSCAHVQLQPQTSTLFVKATFFCHPSKLFTNVDFYLFLVLWSNIYGPLINQQHFDHIAVCRVQVFFSSAFFLNMTLI